MGMKIARKQDRIPCENNKSKIDLYANDGDYTLANQQVSKALFEPTIAYGIWLGYL